MAFFDVFNGDADGICALHQLRLNEPREAELITGVKRDIELLARVEAGAGDSITVLDISLDKNREPLERLLAAGANVHYVDHHYAGDIPDHPGLRAHIDTAAGTCTSLLVDAELNGRFRAWAVAAAFGDNLFDAARSAAEPLSLTSTKLDTLRELGTCLNYNGYGADLDDLFFPPDALYRQLRPFADPFAFVAEEPAYRVLREGYLADMEQAEALTPEVASERYALYLLPDAKWGRRVSGVFGNLLAQRYPERAHALATRMASGGYRISVRAPKVRPEGADDLCRQFPTGGGRKAAAGVNDLPADQFPGFISRFTAAFG